MCIVGTYNLFPAGITHDYLCLLPLCNCAGGSVATCYSDVHILDTRSEGGRLRWIAADVQGPKVCAYL